MSLSDTRRKMRMFSLMCAADMIEYMHQGGMDPSDNDMTEEEFDIFCEENLRTSKVLQKLAIKLLKEDD